MVSHLTRTSPRDEINTASTTPPTGRSGDMCPRPSTASFPLPVSSITSSNRPHPLNLPESSIPNHAAVRGVASSDVVIAVMGLTGAGKSSFVNTAAGRAEVAVGTTLNSQTRGVQTVRCLHPDGLRNVVLVDTPGFDDTHLSDTQILRIIAHWLKETYQNDIKLSGLLYLHRISDGRMAGTPLRNLSVFKDLCGDGNMRNIVFVTTMWDEVSDQSVGLQREEELLSDFWKDMIRLGSRTCRFEGTHKSAWQIIDGFDVEGPDRQCTPLQIQQEMVDRALPFHETSAARTLRRFLVQLAAEFRKGWVKLRNSARRKTSPKEPSGGLQLRVVPSGSSTVGSNSSQTSWFVVSPVAVPTSPNSSAGSTTSACSVNGPRHTLSATIRILRLAHQLADIGHVPMLRGIIGTVLHIAQIIEEMGGTHHAISQVIESSGWLLEEITRYSGKAKLSKDMRRTLTSFQRELSSLQDVVTRISGRGPFARFFLHDADIQAIRACIISIKAVYDKLGVKLAIENSQAIARLEDQVNALCQSTALRQCECGTSAASVHQDHQEDAQGNGQSSTSMIQSA